MTRSLSASCWVALLYLCLSLLPLPLFGQWQADLLPGYSQTTLPLRSDRQGALVATLVRRDTPQLPSRAILYIHGYNDYFFQHALGDSIARHGYAFYALDLRRYGRSLRPHQDAFATHDLREYYEELSLALKAIRLEGAQEIYVLAHSTGGLITSLYLADTGNRDSIAGLILNSPFLDFSFSRAQERWILPVLSQLGALFPKQVASGTSSHPSLYAQSLQAKYHGLWSYRTDWKKDHGHPIRLAWLRAIHRGHRRIQRGLDLPMPILLMSSDSSLHASGSWLEKYGQADLVLDVTDIQRYGRRLGRDVRAVRIRHGLHDLFLSSDSSAYAAAYRQLFHFLDTPRP